VPRHHPGTCFKDKDIKSHKWSSPKVKEYLHPQPPPPNNTTIQDIENNHYKLKIYVRQNKMFAPVLKFLLLIKSVKNETE
jgi:hypothetical protein